MSRCNFGSFLMFIYIHTLSYYKLFLYFNLCLGVILDHFSCSFTSIYIYILSCYKLFLYFNLCLGVILDHFSCSFTSIYIYILSCYKLFLYFNLCLGVMLDHFSCSFTSISYCNIYNFYSGLKVITRKVNTGNYSNQNNSPVPTLNYEINDRVRWSVTSLDIP